MLFGVNQAVKKFICSVISFILPFLDHYRQRFHEFFQRLNLPFRYIQPFIHLRYSLPVGLEPSCEVMYLNFRCTLEFFATIHHLIDLPVNLIKIHIYMLIPLLFWIFLLTSTTSYIHGDYIRYLLME